MASPAKLTLKIGGELTQEFTQSIRKAQKQLSTFSQNVKRSINDAATGASKGFKNVIRNDAFQAAAVGAAGLGTALTSAVRTAANFESAMLRVKAIGGANDEQFAALNASAKKLGRTTQFSASQAAGAMEFLAMSGFETNEIITATPGLLNLAAVGNMELAQSADIASNVLQAMGLGVEQTGSLVDVLAKTASSANVDVSMLGESFKYVAPVAKQAGASLQDMAAAMGVLGNNGIRGSEAGTGLRSVLLRLAAPPKEAAKALANLSVSTRDSQGNMRPFASILTDVNTRMQQLNMGSAERLAIQNALFGKTAVASGAILQEAAANGELAKMVNTVTESQGAAAEMAGTMQSGLGGAMKRLQSAAEGLSLAFGGPLLGPIAAVAEGLVNVLSPVAGLLEACPVLSLALGAVSAAFIGFVVVLPILGAIKGAMLALGITAGGMWTAITGPVGLTIAAIVGVIAIFQLLYNKVDWFRAGVDAILTRLKMDFELFAVGIVSAWNAAMGAVMPLLEAFGQTFSGIMQTISGLIQFVTSVFTGNWEGAAEGFKTTFSGLQTWFGGFINSINALFLGIPGKLVDVGGAIIETIKEGFLSKFQGLKDAVLNGFKQIRDLLPFSDAKKGPFSDLTYSGRALVETIAGGIEDRQLMFAKRMAETASAGMTAFDDEAGKPTKISGTPTISQPVATASLMTRPAIRQAISTPAPTAAPAQRSGGGFGDILKAMLPVASAIIPSIAPIASAAAPLIDQFSGPQNGGMEVAAPAGGAGSGATISIQPVINVQVETGADPEAIAAAVAAGLDDALMETEAGVRALLND